MNLEKMDIDQLLDATSLILLDDEFTHNMKKFEIDTLLEKTQDW